MKQLYKFTNAITNKPIYIDLERLESVNYWERTDVGYDGPPNPGPDLLSCTRIVARCGFYYVKEHISEVLAILEGRDPSPSKILFGNK